MRRNQVKMHDSVVLLLQDRKEAAEDRKMFIELVSDVKEELHLLKYKNDMNSVSVAKIFPVDNQQQLHEFMDDSDGLFQARCHGFYEYLYHVRAPTKKKFRENLKNLLFTDNYCQTHYWPNIV